jgi:hypothetical protein
MWHAWERGEMYTGFWWESPKEKDHLKDQGVDGRMRVKMDLREIGWGGVEWIHLAQDRDHWRALVNAVMNLLSGATELVIIHISIKLQCFGRLIFFHLQVKIKR